MNEELREVLSENYNNYDVLNNLDNYIKKYNQPKSEFNKSEYDKMVYYLMKEYHDSIGLRNLYKNDKRYEMAKELDDIPKKTDINSFYRKIRTIPIQKPELYLLNRFHKMVIHNGAWNHIYSNLLRGDPENQKNLRIYLPVDNSTLNRFAIFFTEECKKNGINYFYKINHDTSNSEKDDQNKYDNVVIYLNEEELQAYITSIKSVLQKHPEIKLNQSNMLGYKYDNNISIAPNIEDGFDAYSSIVCKKIISIRNNTNSKEEFLYEVDNYMHDLLDPISEYCNNIVTKRRGLL